LSCTRENLKGEKSVGGRKTFILWLLLGVWLLASGGRPEAAAAPAKLNQVIYITLSKACGCMLDKCKAGDWVVDQVFVGERQGLLKRIDYSTDKDAAREYIKKYRLTLPPSLIFVDAQGTILWRAEGDLDYDMVLAKLKEFGA
jgi:hypothetical protein